MSLNGPLSVAESNGTIAALHETGGVVKLDSGESVDFDRGSCYRDGTSFPYMREGDRCRIDEPVSINTMGGPRKIRGISSPNGRRWNNPSVD